MNARASNAAQLGLFAAAPAAVEAAPAAPSTGPRPRVVSEDDPAAIAAEIVGDLREVADLMEGLGRDLGTRHEAPGLASDAWVVFVGVGEGEDARPAIVDARNRWAAERDVSLALRVPESRCFAVPATLSTSIVAAIPLDKHPLRRASPPEIGELIELSLSSASERADEELARLREAHARIMGFSAEELDAKLEGDRTGAEREKAERTTRARARRQPPPKKEPAGVAPGASTVAVGKRKLTDRQRELLALVDVDPKTNRVVYQRDEHLSDWAALKQVVELLGGKYLTGGRKTKGGWLFPEDVDAMDMIRAARESGEVLDPKLLGFFPTSDDLADDLVGRLALRAGDRVLEPSGGTGALAHAVRRACPLAEVVCVELLDDHVAALRDQGFRTVKHDFLELRTEDVGQPFDVVAMNPPFGRGRPELAHAMHAVSFLRSGGRLGAILPQSALFRGDARTVEFREFAHKHGAVWTQNERGAFRDAGTMVSTVSMVLTRST